MKNIIFKISDKVLTSSEWHAVRNTEPTIYRVENIGACLVLPGASYNIYMSEPQALNCLLSQATEEISPAPNIGFSEGFILRALAIAQDPKLAKELV